MKGVLLRKVVKKFFGHPATTNLMVRLSHILETEKLKAQNWDNCDALTNGENWLLERVAKHCQIVCDVGANTGDWTKTALEMNPAMQIFAFEASPRTAKLFANNHSQRANVKLINVGLGETNSTLTLNDYGEGSGLTGFISRVGSVGIKPEKTYEVPCMRLDAVDELRGKTIDFLKIDTEGFEVPVLRGALELLTQNRIKIIQFEYGGTWLDSRHLFIEAYQFLVENRLIIGRLLPQGVEWLTSYDASAIETFKYSNFVACNAEMARLLKGTT